MELRIDLRGGGGGDGDQAFSMLTEKWLAGPTKRQEFLAPLRHLVEGRAPDLPEKDVLLAAGPALTVLRQGLDGVQLTRTGAYRVDFARLMAEKHPLWARGSVADELHREADLPMLRDLRAIIEDCGFTYVAQGVAFTTDNAVAMMEQTTAGLLMALGCEIVWDQGFASQAGELCAAAVLAGEQLDPDCLAERIHPILAEFCRSGDQPLEIEATRLAARLWLDLTGAVGVIPDAYLKELRAEKGDRWPQPAGELARACMIAMLRFRVLRATVLTS